MPNYPIYDYSAKDLERVGEALSSKIPWDPSRHAEYVDLFKVAYSWRDSHAWPMRAIRQELVGNVRKDKKKGITSARVKRMKSIRRKLANSTTKLYQMQDLGGCRAIMNNFSELDALIKLYRNGGTQFEIRGDRSYIEKPRDSGYRGHHLILRYPIADDRFKGRQIELQLRTRLQHSWATAVEAVGLVLRQELKSGEGDPDWLRLFALMGSEFAHEEWTNAVPGTPSSILVRREEIAALEQKLSAINFLDNINNAFDVVESIRDPHAKFFLIEFDNKRHRITVQTFGALMRATDSYSAAETGEKDVNTVLVEVDRVGNLRDAYPNYFLDVAMFKDRLQRSLGIPKTERAADPAARGDLEAKGYDLTWLRGYSKTRRT